MFIIRPQSYSIYLRPRSDSP